MKNVLCRYCAILGGGFLLAGAAFPVVISVTKGMDTDLRAMLSLGAAVLAFVITVPIALRYRRKHLSEFPCS